jgi:uncharacterized protein YdaU (DUF1376 family)
MKHYPHHIGDFDKATRHLTRIERSVYRDLIDLYYDTEQRLTLDVQALCRRIIARTNEESTAVQQVLNEFFTETPTGWYHDRCEAEIEAYQANTSQKAMAGKASAEAKRLKKLQALNEPSTAVQQPLNPVATDGNGTPTNHQPSTNQPRTKEEGETPRKRSAPTPSIEKPNDVDSQTWADWLAHRKAKRATVTETVINGARAESEKAGMTLDAFLQVWCRRGTQGLEADWIKPHERQTASRAGSFSEQDKASKRAQWEAMTGRKWPDADTVPEFIDAQEITPKRIAA